MIFVVIYYTLLVVACMLLFIVFCGQTRAFDAVDKIKAQRLQLDRSKIAHKI